MNNQNVKQKLDEMINSVIGLKSALFPDTGTNSSPEPPNIIVPELILIPDGEIPPWILVARQYEGLMEADDREILEPFLGINPDDQAGGLSWCAAFVNAVLKECGIEGTGSNLADSFANWGQECELMDNCIAVFGPGNIPGNHAGFIVKDRTKVLGGNQGDMVRENNLKWYLDNKTLLAYRWPPGYAIPILTV